MDCSVCWCIQALLFAVVLQTEPAVSVRADPDFTAAESSDAAALQQNAEQPSEDHPPEFNAAARREHMDEAAAIRQNKVALSPCPLQFASAQSMASMALQIYIGLMPPKMLQVQSGAVDACVQFGSACP